MFPQINIQKSAQRIMYQPDHFITLLTILIKIMKLCEQLNNKTVKNRN